MFEGVCPTFIRIITIIIFTLLTLFTISNITEHVHRYLQFPQWYDYNIVCIGSSLFYICIAYLWTKSIQLSKCKIHVTIDLIFLSLMVCLFLSSLALWSLNDIWLARICIVMVSIIMMMMIIICFNINIFLGGISVLILVMIIYQLALVFNIQQRRLDND